MSGGSLGYLSVCEVEQFLTEMRIEHVERVRDVLRERGHDDVAAQIEQFLTLLQQTRRACEDVQRELGGVLHAVEWEISRDGYDGQIEDAVIKWRTRNEAI